MPDYKLYRLNSAGQIAAAPEHYEAADDEAAIAVAEERRISAAAELWEGRRLVKRLRA